MLKPKISFGHDRIVYDWNVLTEVKKEAGGNEMYALWGRNA